MLKAIGNGAIDTAIKAAQKITRINESAMPPSGMTTKKLNAFFKMRGLSDMLHYRRFYAISPEDEFGVYEMADGRRGFILQITPPPYLGSKSQQLFRNTLKKLALEGHVVHVTTYASKNLDYEINRWKTLHHCNSKVDSPGVLREWVDSRANAYKKWTKETMMRNADVRLRNFVTTVSVLAPYGSSDDHLIDLYRVAMSGFEIYAPACFYPQDLLRMTNELFKPTKGSYEPKYDPQIPLNQQIGQNTSITITEDDRVRETITIDSKVKMKTLTTVRMPKFIDAAQYQQLFYDIFGEDVSIPVPGSYMVSMTISAKNIKRTADKAVDKAASDLEWLRKMGIKDVDKNPQFGDRFNECQNTIMAVKEKGERLFKTMYQIFVFEENETKLDRQCKSLMDRFELSENGGWILEPEKHQIMSVMTLLYSMPLMYLDYVQENQLKHRFFHRWTSNNANTAPIVTGGRGIGDFKNVFVDRYGQMMRVDWSAESNQNIVIIGPMGTGKSFLINELLMSHAAMGYRIRAFDLGGSSKAVCKNIGGKHTEFDIENDVCMNFFTNIIEIEQEYFDSDSGRTVKGMVIHPEEYTTIIPMIGLMCKQDLKSPASEFASEDALRVQLGTLIQRAVELAHRRRGRQAGMREVVEALKEFRSEMAARSESTDQISMLIAGLFNYGDINGQFYRYFNGANNIDISDYDMAVFEFEKLKNMGDLLYVAQAGIMQKIAVEFFYNREIPKVFGVDEAKVMALDNKVMISYLEDFALRLRKYGAVFYLATQDAGHFFTSDPRARSMFTLAAWKIFLPRDEASILGDIKIGALSENARFENRLMESLKFSPPNFSEVYIKGTKRGMVCRIKVDPYSYWLYTTDPKDFARLLKVEEEYGIDRAAAITYMAKTWEGYHHDKALEIARGGTTPGGNGEAA